MSLAGGGADAPWLRTMRGYLVWLVPLMLAWETVQLPLYTLWQEGTPAAIAFAVIHCTGGDALIGMGALGTALLLVGHGNWPHIGFARVLAVATVIGVAVTVYLEWLNVEVKGAWAYAAAMPRLPPLGTGLSPVMQWVVIPPLALLAARRWARATETGSPSGRIAPG